jgi:serine/threonine protein kinase
MELHPNTLLRDRYRIEKQLGKGGMGAVYLAHDTVLDTKVAVKINQNPRPEGRDQFIQEARLLAALRHPNLPRVIDYFVIEENQFLVMDFVPGDDLGSIVSSDGMQSIDQVLSWAHQLGNALIYLHSQEPPVIHRDIKPANIKITPRGQAMLVDFGIAKSTDLTQETSTGARGLTPGYSPPEQYGTARTGHFSDQFGFAATLYNLLTNQKPVDAVERLLGQAVLTPIHLLNPTVPLTVQQAIERAMSIKPEDRFSSVAEFMDALGTPTVAKERLSPVQPAKTVLPTIQPVVSQDATRVGNINPPPVIPVSVQPNKRALWLIPVILLALVVLAGGSWLLFSRLLTPQIPTQSPTADVALSVTLTLGALPTQTAQPSLTVTQAPTETDTPEPTATVTFTPEITSTATPVLESIGRDGLAAFASNEADGSTFQIWSMRVYKSETGELIAANKSQLTNNPGNKYYPAWSPDGGQIVFSADSGDSENKLDLWVMDDDGQNQRNILTIPGDETEAAWSPDGKWIAFTTNSRADGILQIMIVHPDGSGLRRLSTDRQEYAPEWSPRMDKLVYVLPSNDLRYLWVRDPQNDFVDANQDLMFGRLKYFTDPSWSPNGEWLAYTRVEGRTQDVFLTRIASYGLEIKRLTNSTFDSYPAWSSDSAWLLFQSNRDGNQEIYVMDIQGQQLTNLTKSDTIAEIQPAWQVK